MRMSTDETPDEELALETIATAAATRPLTIVDAPRDERRAALAAFARRHFGPIQSQKVEAAGIEPASADAPDKASTSVVCALISPGGRFADDLPTG